MKYKVYPLSITPFLLPPSARPFFTHSSFIHSPSLSTINVIMRPLIFLTSGPFFLLFKQSLLPQEQTRIKKCNYFNTEQCCLWNMRLTNVQILGPWNDVAYKKCTFLQVPQHGASNFTLGDRRIISKKSTALMSRDIHSVLVNPHCFILLLRI
jgi:hypothetical protein